jgi:hypothetical protein
MASALRSPAVLPVLLGCVLLPIGCGGDNAVAARVACYPDCVARIVERCPLISLCNVQNELNMSIPNEDVSQGVATCFASGEKVWQATNVTSGDSYVVVKHADGTECYSAISLGSSGRYTISVGARTYAELDVGSSTTPLTITCGGTTTEIVTTPACSGAPWMNPLACEPLTCTFGIFPIGAATDEPMN